MLGVFAAVEFAGEEHCVDSPVGREKVRRGVQVTPVANGENHDSAKVVQALAAKTLGWTGTERQDDVWRSVGDERLQCPVHCCVLILGQRIAPTASTKQGALDSVVFEMKQAPVGKFSGPRSKTRLPDQHGPVIG